MKLLKRNYGWLIVAILAILPLIPLSNMALEGGKGNIDMFYHISGEFAIRWMTAVLSCTPFFILFGVNNLFVRQAMGITTAMWSFLHFGIFIWAEGLLETFTQFNYIAGFIAILILIPLFFTSNRKGRQMAITATARKLAIIVWRMMTNKEEYKPTESHMFLDEKRKLGIVKRMKKKIAKLGITNQDLGLANLKKIAVNQLVMSVSQN